MKPSKSFREIIFGLEDGAISTLGVITGIASGTQDKFTILLAGIVVISVESLSMAAGTYLSNKSEEEYYASKTKLPLHEKLHRQSIGDIKHDAFFMGISYILGGLFPLIPYLFFPVSIGIIFSIILSVIGLLLVGAIKAKITRSNILKGAIEMSIISISAALVGYLIGELVANLYPTLKNI